MSDLDDKLNDSITVSLSIRKATTSQTEMDAPNGTQWFRPNGGELWFFEFDKEAVKQAFKDSGWLDTNQLGGIRSTTVYGKPGVEFMIGQEWYDRFESEISNIKSEGMVGRGHIWYTDDEILDAARKAAGLE